MVRDQERATIPPDGRSMDQQPKWRQDFAIDWPEDHYVSRRDFTKFMVLTSLAFTVGQLWIALRNIVRGRRGKPALKQIATMDQLGVGAALTFTYPEAQDTCILVRTKDNEFVAFSQKCTHLSCAVIPKPEEGRFHCPCHEGYFDLATGEPLAGPPRRSLPRIGLEIQGGAIYATGEMESL